MEIIDSYDKLPLGMYLEILDICDDRGMEEDDQQMEIISLLCGKSVDELLKTPLPEFMRYASATAFLEKKPEMSRRGIPKEYRLGDMVLTLTTDVTKLTAAQYIDFQTFKDLGRGKMAEQLSCFFVPKGMVYSEGYDVKDVQDTIRRCLSVTDAMTLYAFFLKKFKDSIRAMLIYSALMLRGTRATKKVRREMREKIRQAWTALR